MVAAYHCWFTVILYIYIPSKRNGTCLDIIDIKNKDIHGLRIREIRLPTDIIILSIKRGGQLLMTHGYTRLRLGDVITLVGSPQSLEAIKFKFDT